MIRSGYNGAMRRGSTLIELVLVCTILALLAAVGLPAFAAARDRLAVRHWASLISAAHSRARLAAMAEQRVMLLTITADSITIRAVVSAADTARRWLVAGPATAGVALAGAPRTVPFAPIGLAFGLANGTYTVSRGGAVRQVVVSRYGRVRIN
jgi:Tfp pilus assembly protein FimT